MSLRDELIRLAYSAPQIRPDLLPLLRQTVTTSERTSVMKAKFKGTGKDKVVQVTIDGHLRTLYNRDGQVVYVHDKPDSLLGDVTISLHPNSPRYSVHRTYLTTMRGEEIA